MSIKWLNKKRWPLAWGFVADSLSCKSNWAAKMPQTEEFMLPNMDHGPTVHKTGPYTRQEMDKMHHCVLDNKCKRFSLSHAIWR